MTLPLRDDLVRLVTSRGVMPTIPARVRPILREARPIIADHDLATISCAAKRGRP